jgi:hypothetical protein
MPALRVVTYARTNTRRQAGRLEQQREQARRYCAGQGYEPGGEYTEHREDGPPQPDAVVEGD